MHFSIRLLALTLLSFAIGKAWAQPKLEFNMKKPEQFSERKLGSEKLAEKKYTFTRKVFQNTFTHFNYYFNANEKIKQIIAYATEANKDDYTELLNYYPFSIESTKKSSDIDSILQSATAGILLHDLRNSYIDNLYLVIGKAYFLRGDFDSAAMAFQFINTSYAPKEKDGYDQPIGSNSVEGSNAFTISTKEKTGISQKVFSHPPSRNESFVWLIRTLVEKGEYIDASSLVQTLRNDPNFPDRLEPDLSDAMAYGFYRLEMWDSAVTYLEKAMPLRKGAEEKSRAWYLAGQLHQLSGNYESATKAFAECSKIAVDPVMDVYARLNSIRMRKSEDPGIIDKNIADLLSMAKKDRYYNYRDLIYYAAGLFEAERNGFEPAENYLYKSIANNNNAENPEQRSRSFKLLGDVRYQAKRYGGAAQPYDSVNTVLLKPVDSLEVEQRKPGCETIFVAEKIIELQDSLLSIAALPEPERTDRVKEISRKLRKERGIKEDAASTGSTAPGAKGATDDTFTSTGSGPWYFYDAPRRTNGKERFLERWGDRPNVDNWRRSASISISATVRKQGPDFQPNVMANQQNAVEPEADVEKYDTTDISFDNLYSRLPLSDEKKLRAENRITNQLYIKARALHEKIEDYPEAIKYYEMVLERQDTGRLAKETLFALIYCYTKTGDNDLAAKARAVLQQRFPSDSLTMKATGKVKPNDAPTSPANPIATKAYQDIYDLYLQGEFAKATAMKKKADSTYGKTYWTPQLSYIETVYLLKEKQDSAAMLKLNEIITNFPNHPLAEKAKLIKEVLPKRKEIEEYLTKLDIQRAADDQVTVAPKTSPKPVNIPKEPVKINTPKEAPKVVVAVDTMAKKPVEVKVAETPSPYPINAKGPQLVAIVLENIDPAYVNETIYSLNSSPKRSYNGNSVEVEKLKLRDKLFLAVLRSPGFTNADNAFEYIDYLKPVAAKEILSWLDAKKYRFIIISEENLEKLKQEPTLDLYEKILKQTFPSEF